MITREELKKLNKQRIAARKDKKVADVASYLESFSKDVRESRHISAAGVYSRGIRADKDFQDSVVKALKKEGLSPTIETRLLDTEGLSEKVRGRKGKIYNRVDKKYFLHVDLNVD